MFSAYFNEPCWMMTKSFPDILAILIAEVGIAIGSELDD
jgi:hypothetical protein